jgi:hypothetical protein
MQQNFEYEEVKAFIDTSIEPILGNQVYAPKKVGDWTSAIVEAVLKLLQAANKPFKYVGQSTRRGAHRRTRISKGARTMATYALVHPSLTRIVFVLS